MGLAHKENISDELFVRQNGVYLITGGMGGIGIILAEYLCGSKDSKIVLSGRSGLKIKGQNKLSALNDLAHVEYIQADLSRRSDTEHLVKLTTGKYGPLRGIFHCAGETKDSLLVNKKLKEVETVIGSKIFGTVNLDTLTRKEPLDFFVMFSSVAALFGNIGQCDYAFANRFMDSFAQRRENMRRQGIRNGLTLSINWPEWKDGGMRLSRELQKRNYLNMGVKALDTDIGIKVIEKCFRLNENQLAVLYGEKDKILATFLDKPEKTGIKKEPGSKVEKRSQDADQSLKTKNEENIRKIVSEVSGIAINRINQEEEFSRYGFDSIVLTRLTNKVNEVYQLEISPAIFFEYTSILSFSEHLYNTYYAIVERHFLKGHSSESVSKTKPLAVKQDLDHLKATESVTEGARVSPSGISNQVGLEKQSSRDVAIIGMSGTMPQSKTLDIFWENLIQGKHLISEIPADRWDWRAIYGDPHEEKNRTNIKWGGFIPDIDKFDYMFFGLSRREAELMDPQQRIFLQTVWATIEDAGYDPTNLSGTATGIFVGVSTGDYNELIWRSGVPVQAYTSSGGAHSILANRISYLLNLKGPSEPIDTACSSTLIAVHRGVEEITKGNCEMAIAGGVNALLTPTLYISFNKAGMLAKDGKCKTFDAKANGYVRGEGAGALLLKPLDKAIRDNDHIYAVVKGTAINHGGRANSLTAPNPNAQADVIVEAYRQAGISPATVNYVETHGTGTPLGDPVEVNGLKKAFKMLHNENFSHKTCGIGSVKTNIGHLEAAAGAAGMIKLLLALKHKKLPPSIHFEELNPFIQMKDSPFYVVEKAIDWQPALDGDAKPLPRRAAVSSFGFGGVNAHVIVEEHKSDNAVEKEKAVSPDKKPQMIVLSAGNKHVLRNYVWNMISFFEKRRHPAEPEDIHMVSYRLADIAFTLQTGRKALDYRLAFWASTIDEMIARFKEFNDSGNQSPENLFYSKIAEKQPEKNDMERIINEFDHSKAEPEVMAELANYWTLGGDFSWSQLYPERNCQRLSLPTYPFAEESCWIENDCQAKVADFPESANLAEKHALADKLTAESTLKKRLYCFTGQEFFFTDHLVNQTKTLPGALLIELAIAATQNFIYQQKITLNNIIWITPVQTVDKEACLAVNLTEASEAIHFDITSGKEGSDYTLNCKGHIEIANRKKGMPLPDDINEDMDIEALKSRFVESREPEDCYREFDQKGLIYGPHFQTIRTLYVNDTEALALLKTKGQSEVNNAQFFVPPPLLDGAFQAIAGIIDADGVKQHRPYVPFSIGKLEIFKKFPETCYAYVRKADAAVDDNRVLKKINIRIINEKGEIIAKITDFTVRIFEEKAEKIEKIGTSDDQSTSDPYSLIYFEEHWKPVPVSAVENDRPDEFEGVTLIFDSDTSWSDKLTMQNERVKGNEIGIGKQLVTVVPGKSFKKRSSNIYQINTERLADYIELIEHIVGNDDIHLRVVHTLSQRPFNPNPNYMYISLTQSIHSVFYLAKSFIKVFADRAEFKKGECKADILYLYTDDGGGYQPIYRSVGAFAKSVRMESPEIRIKTVGLVPNQLSQVKLSGSFCSQIWNEFNKMGVGSEYAQYVSGERAEKRLRKITAANAPKPVVLDKSTILITGGCGGLGFMFAKHLSKDPDTNIILTGRRPEDDEIEQKIAVLSQRRGAAEYVQADVSNPLRVSQLIGYVAKAYGRIDGIIHCAGLNQDNFLYSKTEDEFKKVLAAKVNGIVNLDEASQNQPLQFFIAFSSTVALSGNIGQSDYAFGNAFMDNYCRYREILRKERKRNGKSISINWPLWGDGGMQLNDQYIKRLKQQTGMVPLKTSIGLDAFGEILRGGRSQIAVSYGNARKIETVFGLADQKKDLEINLQETIGKSDKKDRTYKSEKNKTLFPESVNAYLKGIFASVLKIDEKNIDVKTPYERYGVDSLAIIEINKILEKDLGSLPVTLVFESKTISALTDYLIHQHSDRLASIIPGYLSGNIAENSAKTRTEINEVISSSLAVPQTIASKSEYAKSEGSGSGQAQVDVIGLTEFSNSWEVLLSDLGNISDTPIHKGLEAKQIFRKYSGKMIHLRVKLDDGKNMEVVTYGTGKPVVLICGIGATAPLWYYQFRDLAENYQLIVVHKPGHGRSDPSSDLSIEGVSAKIKATIDKLGLNQPFHLIGTSFGGLIAQYIAGFFSESVKTLVLSTTSYAIKHVPLNILPEIVKNDFDNIVKNIKNKNQFKNPEKYYDLFLGSNAMETAAFLRYTKQAAEDASTLDFIHRINVPTFIISGAQDSLFEVSDTDRLHAEIQGSEFYRIHDAGHFLPITHHDDFNSKVLAFLDKHE